MLLDNESSDGDYQELLSHSEIPSRYVRVQGKKFSKVKALNEGLANVPDNENNIAMVLDLHLQLPDDFFDRTRKVSLCLIYLIAVNSYPSFLLSLRNKR